MAKKEKIISLLLAWDGRDTRLLRYRNGIDSNLNSQGRLICWNLHKTIDFKGNAHLSSFMNFVRVMDGPISKIVGIIGVAYLHLIFFLHGGHGCQFRPILQSPHWNGAVSLPPFPRQILAGMLGYSARCGRNRAHFGLFHPVSTN